MRERKRRSPKCLVFANCANDMRCGHYLLDKAHGECGGLGIYGVSTQHARHLQRLMPTQLCFAVRMLHDPYYCCSQGLRQGSNEKHGLRGIHAQLTAPRRPHKLPRMIGLRLLMKRSRECRRFVFCNFALIKNNHFTSFAAVAKRRRTKNWQTPWQELARFGRV